MPASPSSSDLLLANVGNTHTQLAFWNGAAFHSARVVETAKLADVEIPDGVPCALASVSPRAERLFKSRELFLLSARTARGLDLSAMDASTIGADRLANAFALAATGPLPAVCFDFGTAITCEILDPAKRLLGGAILPGRTLQRKALREHTAKLPLTALSSSLPAMPGANTVDAIAAGVDRGSVGAVLELLAATRALFPGRELRALACGGDARFFLDSMPGVFEDGGADFTLRGLLLAWELRDS